MSSWSGSHPPPPRGERSRSPSRGAYGRPAYPDPPYAAEPYRSDWDHYSRERAWADWERDKAAYDYGRRPRSRSPPYDDLGRKRRRSMSPYDRERYEPRPRYDDYEGYRGYGHSPPRGRGQYGHGYGSRPSRAPVDPHTLDYPANLKQYAEWFRYYYPQQAAEEDAADKSAEQEAGDGSKPRNGLKTKWEKYKKDFLAQQLQTLFDHHRKSPWFAEKYDPSTEFANVRSRVRKIGWRGRMNQFVNELEDGKFDSSFNENEPEPSSPVKEGSSVPENGAADDTVKNEEEFGMGLEGEEEAADNAGDIKTDANGKSTFDAKRPGKDEVSVMPEGNQVMIRTIPPDIGRMKLETAIKDMPGFVYLALGDPMQKRNYYRAGWIKFTEEVDMQKVITVLGEKKIEGFKLHVNHNNRPFSNKVRYAPEVASRPDRIAKDLEQVKKLVSLLEEEHERLRTFKPKKPAPKESAEVTVDEQNGAAADKDAVDVAPPEEDVLMTDAIVEDEEPREKGSEAVERRIAKLVSELPEPANEADGIILEVKKNTIALDIYLTYLRVAFHTCYYCVSVSDHLEELQRKCIKHVRKPLSKLLAAEIAQQAEASIKAKEEEKEAKEEEEEGQEGAEKEKEKDGDKTEIESQEKAKENTLKERERGGEARDWKRNDERWLDWLDNRVALLINKDGIDVRDYGGKHYDDELSKAVEPHVKQEDEGKFRCKTCAKLFKATSFVEKHIVNKHSELVKQLEEIPFYNNFALDPQRIQPFTHYPQPVGNGQGAPPQAYGLQNVVSPYMDHGRGGPAPYHAQPVQYPPYANGYVDPYAYQSYYTYPPVAMAPPPARSLRDEPPLSAGGGRRLGDRIGGYAAGHEHHAHGIEGLPAKPVATLEPGPGGRKNGRGPPPPPPPDAKEDPRAAAGRKVSYHDMDLVAEGDVELTY